ncbi:protein S40-7-like isoform X2 [Typha latifolia]|uniref:protein S40-7-like isoform X2 n=1 Tax=Typha latifolia TaxID=4733 RepID=UPI003C3092AA
MERFLTRRSPGSGRFLAVFASPQSNGSAGFELHEDELFAAAESPQPDPPSPLSFFPNRNPNSIIASFRSPAQADGILAALPGDDRLRSSSSSARMIPAVPKPKTERSVSVPGGGIRQQSAPVNVPVVPMRARRRRNADEVEEDDEEAGDEDEMLPPHEIVARARARESPMTTFSVLEGAGRTLKGRDLKQVRNAVWRKTDFLLQIPFCYHQPQSYECLATV